MTPTSDSTGQQDRISNSAAGFVYAAPDPSTLHKCQPPERDVMIAPPSASLEPVNYERVAVKVGTTPSVPVGSVWRCECGQQWIVRWDAGVRKYGYTPAHAYWDRARWLERRRARRLAHA